MQGCSSEKENNCPESNKAPTETSCSAGNQNVQIDTNGVSSLLVVTLSSDSESCSVCPKSEATDPIHVDSNLIDCIKKEVVSESEENNIASTSPNCDQTKQNVENDMSKSENNCPEDACLNSKNIRNFQEKNAYNYSMKHKQLLQVSKKFASAPYKINARNRKAYMSSSKLLNSVRKRPLGRPRKHFEIAVKKLQSPARYDDDDGNDYSSVCKEENNESEESGQKCKASKINLKKATKKLSEGDEGVDNRDSGEIKKRGRPRLIPDQAIKPGRGRPRLTASDILIKKRRKSQMMAKKVLMQSKKKRKPEFGPNNSIIKKKGRPRLTQKEKWAKITARHFKSNSKPILQNMSCLDFLSSEKLPKCRECRIASYKTKKISHSYCRFLEYRKLCIAKNGRILFAGFSEPSDSTESDKQLWLPEPTQPPQDLNIDTSKELLIQVGDQFCDLVLQEKEALSLNIGPDIIMSWKKLVQGVREMCDVCDTTLFNIHWVCPTCGLAVCIDCYKVRKQGIIMESEDRQKRGRDDYLWLYCNGKEPHDQEELIMAQIVPGDALWNMSDLMHEVRKKWNIEAHCKCIPQNDNNSNNSVKTGLCKQLIQSVSKSFEQRSYSDDLRFENNVPTSFPGSYIKNSWFRNSTNDLSSENQSEVFNTTCYEMVASIDDVISINDEDEDTQSDIKALSVVEIYKLSLQLAENTNPQSSNPVSKEKVNKTSRFNQRYPQPNSGRDPLPLRIFSSTESNVTYKNIPHSWLCNGRLLLLHQPDHAENLLLFQEQWKRGQPIMVMGVDSKLDMSLWHPSGFCNDFGEIKNDLVNCRTGKIIRNLPMKKFWLGFENFEERMKDESGEYMLLKLKDWPPGEDFSEKLPKRFQDLMKGLPLPEYTHRDGIFNLAGRLPSWFVRPDLGPKMYNAYGSAIYPTKGTTNLHLDVSDAVNVMVYVGIPHDGQDEQHIVAALKAIDEGGCDSLTRERVRSKGVRPGALWHIYDARNADKIRALLTQVAIERGEKLEAHHDPIHDQSWYLDAELRERLYRQYRVEGYAIAQCLGDAVFIPAGAPHQVRNLHSCVKVAEDFVSPENVAHCFTLTQEFRNLSDTHTNHEDKLQIKNIIYHVVKDALSHLLTNPPGNSEGLSNNAKETSCRMDV